MRYRQPLICIAMVCLMMQACGGGRARAAGVDRYDVEVVETNADLSQRLTRLSGLEFGSATVGREQVIKVNAGVRYQSVKGFGAAMTDTSAWLIERETSVVAREALMDELFGAKGIRLSFVRVPMGASDFTHDGQPYSYDDLAAGRTDPGLKHFSIAHDQGYVLPALRQVRALDPNTEFLASPWTAPAWMKRNNSLGNISHLGRLRVQAMSAWGEYFAKFIRAYARAGVPIGAITVQNEPRTATSYPGLSFSASREAKWIVHDLEPALARAKEHPRIYAGDLGWGTHNKAYLRKAVFGRAAGALSGIAWHCYFGAPGVMGEFHRAEPRLDQILDECSPGGISPTPTSEIVIASMRDWASTVALWNLALDQHGGPVQIPNTGCPACVGLATIDERTGAVSLTRSYYQLGQASAFVAPGARRIASTHFVSYSYPHSGVNVVTPGLDDVAFRNPDGSLVLVAYNNSSAASSFAIHWRARALTYNLPAGAMVTLVWNRA